MSNISFPQTLTTYLGNKGYTLFKSELSATQQLKIRELLTVKPYVPGAPPNGLQPTYPVYRESTNKFYVPRYFGEKWFGKPKETKITEGDNISLQFTGELREYQKPVVEQYLQHVHGGGGGLLELYCGFGKTDLTVYLIGAIGKKALIIVHKEFLMNQWIERILKYYPNARIGKIQGQTIDIDDKDIVICMLQSLSMKEYPTTLFDSFGFTIIDEVHHISSEVFSRALFKLVTKYMIGLSATMNRKDGTTKVFKMFLGEVVCKRERSKDEELIVRAITYKSRDAEFNKLEMDFRGQIAASKMLSKICNYSHRTEFILTVLQDMLVENPLQQIMILGSYKNILSYLFDAINHRNLCTVGYYIGGMKESQLKESEGKQVVLATYAMAAEGLDIKTLSTLIMGTPMTNIEQSVGRILRQKHAFAAMVIDIVDVHDNFYRQWLKRKAFYKKQNYKIVQTNSDTYMASASKDSTSSIWKVAFAPQHNTDKSELCNNIADGEDTNEDENEDDDQDPNVSKKTTVGKCLLSFKKN